MVDAISDQSTLTDKIEDTVAPLTLGQRVADRVASFGGSWTFIISFMVFHTMDYLPTHSGYLIKAGILIRLFC